MLCPICGSSDLEKQEIRTQEKGGGMTRALYQCLACRVLFDAEYQKERSEVYGAHYAAWGNPSEEMKIQIARDKKQTFRRQLKKITAYLDPQGKKILDVGTAHGYLLEVAGELGLEAYGTEISEAALEIARQKFPGKIWAGPLEKQKLETAFFDAVALTDVLEHLSNPVETIREISRILKPGGILLIISPNSDSWTRKFWGRNWFQYKYEHLFYFNRRSLEKILENNNMQLRKFENNRKCFSLNYYFAYFQKYSFGYWGKTLLKIYPFLPRLIQNARFSNPISGEFLAIAQKKWKD